MKKKAIAIAKSGVCQTTIFISSLLMNLYSQQKSPVLFNNDILMIRTDGISFLGSGMNEADAKTFAINDAKRTALEQAGTYLESHTTVINYKLVKDEIITFSAGLVKVRVLNATRRLINDMFAYKVDIEATIDIKLLDERIKEIQKDSGLRQQLEAERERNLQLEAKISALQSSGSIASKQTVINVLNELSASEWIETGLTIAEKGDINSSLQYFSKAIELDPRNAWAYFCRGQGFGELSDHNSAIQDFNKAIELDFPYAMVYRGRGAAYANLGKLALALQDFTKAIELDPQNAQAYYGRGLVYAGLGKLAMALQDFTKAIELNPQNAVAYYGRGVAYYNLNEYKMAAQDYNDYLRINGNKNGNAEQVRQKIRDLGYTPQY
jgi:tetratricopeptide (TPR) repeat protein